jgi:uncharacterized membrane protein
MKKWRCLPQPLFPFFFVIISRTRAALSHFLKVFKDLAPNGVQWVKKLRYGTIVRRIGVILLLTGIVIALVSTFRDFNRLSSSMDTYIWAGLIIVGAILLIVFVIDFELKERKRRRTLT